VIKALIFCLFAATIAAQPVFQKKIDGLQVAEGLACLPDGGFVLAGLQGNCIQIVRLEADGSSRWNRQVCLINVNDDVSFGRLYLEADQLIPGAFFLIFRKGAFSSSPANLLNLMKFDANGELLWETQLRPEKRYGAFSSGSQLATTPMGATWVTHGMGFTDALPDFNQILLFKIDPLGNRMLRKFFLTVAPATSNGIAAKNDQEALIYGGLANATGDGLLIKVDEKGDEIWAKRYEGLNFLKDGGFFSNGDLLLLAQQKNAYALVRIDSDGSIIWAAKCKDTLGVFHVAVTEDGGVVLAARKTDDPFFLFKVNTLTSEVIWAKTYEACTKYQLSALESSPEGGLVFTQSSNIGDNKSRVIKSDGWGQLSPECPFWELPSPHLEPISSSVFPVQFTTSGSLTDGVDHAFVVSNAPLKMQDCCPGEYPEARFVLPDSVCVSAPFNLVSTGNSCADTWHWQIPDVQPGESQDPGFQNIIIQQEGYIPVTLTETIGVCSDTAFGVIHAVAAPEQQIFAFSDTIICPDVPFQVQANVSGLDTWTWFDGSNASTITVDPPIPGVYQLVAEKGLCAVADSFRIRFGNCGPTRVFVPNVFSPDEDGENDLWEIFGQPGVTPINCQVYDRWGNQCYATHSAETPAWDGMFQGRRLPGGVYVWQFRFLNPEGKEEMLAGDLLLVR
jgi:gliding motility-associated-like protein